MCVCVYVIGGLDKLPENLKRVVASVPAAHDPQTRPFRKRPFVYIYELPPKYNTMMLQHRLEGGVCINRCATAVHAYARAMALQHPLSGTRPTHTMPLPGANMLRETEN